MKIGIDASRYKIDKPTGVEWYSYHLLNALIPVLGRDHNLDVTLYTQKETCFDADFPFNVHQKVIPRLKFWTLLRLSWELLLRPVDLLFVPSHILPLRLPKKTVVTVHDIAFKVPGFEKAYDLKNKVLLHWSTKRAVRKAYKIIVPSHSTKEDLIKYFDCNESKIEVVYHGGPDITGENNPLIKKWSQEEKTKIYDKYGLKSSDLFALYVGRIEYKKNLANLVEGFSRLIREYPDWKLVLAGKPGQGYDEVEAKIIELGMQNDVIITGYITEDEKRFLMGKCRVFAFPSRYEGFGLPILEAFAYRRPVITSNISSMPEIAGEAAYLVNPDNVAEISVALKRMIMDGVLISKLISEGEIQLEKFSWDKAAQETFEVLTD